MASLCDFRCPLYPRSPQLDHMIAPKALRKLRDDLGDDAEKKRQKDPNKITSGDVRARVSRCSLCDC